MGKIVPSALSQYDNEVKKTSSSNGNFKGKLSGGLNGFISGLSDKISGVIDDKVKQLNELAKGKLGGLLGGLGNLLNFQGSDFLKNALQGLLGKAMGALSGYLNNAIQMLKALGTDTLRQLTNASLNYLANIAEDYINNIKSSLFIDDKIFLATIQGLYYNGADLAYNSHYLRNQCLKRDWCETLKFVDGEYGVNYNTAYVRLRSDIKTCSMNSCHKNLFYIFGKIHEEIKNYESLIETSDKKIEYYKMYKGYEKENGYKTEVSTNRKYKQDKELLEKLMVEGLKNLIIFSYTYTTASDIRRFFTAYPDILKPKYYGSNDDKYRQAYMFNAGDCATMLPFFTKHNLSQSDIATMERISEQSEKLNDYNNKLSDNGRYDVARNILNDNNSSSYDKGYAYAIIEREEARNKSLKSQNDRSASLALTALTKGAKGVHEDARARHPMQNDLKNRVKYREKDVSDLLDDTFNTKDQYTVPRNKNIKAIYILLSSKEIYADSYMINENFYKRCKYPTMTTLNAAADKAKGLIGASFLAQAMYDISDAVDGSAYRYTKKVEKYLLNPKTNVSDISVATQVTFDQDNLNSIELPEDLHDSLQVALNSSVLSNTNGEITVANGVNVASVSELEKEADKNLSVKKDIADSVRYVQSLPMMKKKEMILNYLVKFYHLCANYGIDERELKKSYSRLTYYIFAKKINNPNDLYGTLLDNATNESLSRNIQTVISIQKTGSLVRIMQIENSKYRDTYVKLFDLVCNSLNLESSTSGFVQMTFNYDKEHLSSLLKQYYLQKLAYLRSINDKSNPNYKNFYTFKDSMTKTFEGFDRNGVFGYSEEKGRLRYTNIETGDWRAIHYSPKNGTFFAGSMNTNGNGIMKLNESIEELRSTNITSGNWIKMIEYSDELFFINEDDSIWYWNGNSVIKTSITDFKNWEFEYFEGYDIIFLKGKNNNGIKVWRNGSFETITTLGDGWVYEPINNNSYYILYPSDAAGMSYFFNLSATFIPTNITGSITSWFLTIPELTYTYEQKKEDSGDSSGSSSGSSSSSSSSSGSGEGEEQTEQIEVTQYQCHFMIATKASGVWDCMSAVSDSTLFIPSNTQPKLMSKFDPTKINILYKNSNTNESCFCIDGLNIYNVTFLATKDGGSALPSVDENKIIDRKDPILPLIGGGVTSYNIVNTTCTKYGIFAEQVKVMENGSSVSELWYYDRSSSSNNRNKIADRSLSGISFFIGEDGVTTFGQTSNNYYICTKTNMIQVLTNSNDIKPGWILEYVNNTYFMVNHTNPLGIRLIRNNVAINTNITDGYWNVTCSDTKLFAMSIKNTNKGIRYTSKGNPTSFGSLPTIPYNYQDVYGYAYNPERKVLYFGSCRDELLLNIDAIVYDIDLYIYILTLYQIKQKLQGFAYDNGNIGLNSVLKTLEEKKASGEEMTEEDFNNLNNMIDEYNSDLNSQISEQRDTEKSSGLYTDLLTYAEAMREFDVDSNTAKESLLLSMINDYDYVPSFDEQQFGYSIVDSGIPNRPDPNTQYYTKDDDGIYHACPKPLLEFEPGVTYYTYVTYGPKANNQERFLATISYTRMVRKFDVNNTPAPGEIGTHNWNKQYNHVSDDFLNTDEEFVDYTIGDNS